MTKAAILDGLPDSWKYTENNGLFILEIQVETLE